MAVLFFTSKYDRYKNSNRQENLPPVFVLNAKLIRYRCHIRKNKKRTTMSSTALYIQ